MKKYISIPVFLILLVSATCHAGITIMRTRGGAAPSSCDNATYFCSDFEDETDDGQWNQVSAGTWNDDYATAPAPLEGSESCYWGGAANYRTDAWTGSDSTVYMSGIIHFVTAASGHNLVIYFQTSADGYVGGRIQFDENGDNNSFSPRYYYNNNGSYQEDTIDPAEGETWYWKVEYNNSTSWAFYLVQDDSGFPGWGAARFSTATTDSAQAAKLYLYTSATGSYAIIDDIRVHDSSMDY